ncbi:MAG: MMPL family transporter [Candidatus Ozemobacteraceae bacterium]
MSAENTHPAFIWASKFLVRHRVILFWVMVVCVVGGLVFAPRIRIDNSLELWFLEDDPTLTGYREFKKIYGNDEIILALVDCGEKGMFTKDALNSLYKASKAIKDDRANIKRVLSVGLAPHIGLDGQTLIVEDLMTKEASDEPGVEEVKKRFFGDPLKAKLLCDLSQKYAVFLIEPVSSPDMDVKRPQIIASVKEKLGGLKYQLAGMGVMYDELNQLSLRDGFLFTAISYLVIGVLIFLLYRSVPFSLIVVTVMILGGCFFVGIYGLFRQNFNMVTVVLPTLMMILSISDVAYVFNNYCFNRAKVIEDKEKGLEHVFTECLSPCLFTSITNGLGFVTIVTSPMAVLRGFGLFAGLCCMAEYLISMISAAYILGRLKPDAETELHRPFAGWVDGWVKLMPRYYRVVMVSMIICLVVGIYGITQLNVDTYSMGLLHANNSVRMDSDAVEKIYGNYLPLEIRLLTGKEDGIKDPEFLRKLDKTHTDLEALPGVQRAASVIDVFKKLNQVMTDGSSASYVIPDTFDKASQLMMLYGGDPDNDLRSLTDERYSEARLTVRVPMVSASRLQDFEERVGAVVRRNFGIASASNAINATGAVATGSVKLVFGGYVPLYARLISYITYSQVSSFGWALITIFGTMALLLRRWEAMILGIIPNLFPIVMTMGMMGLLGINLDIATVTIASIALGIAVDDTIHELFLFYDPARKHLDPVESISECLIEAGPAVVSTSIIYALGFSALIFASIKSVILFGGLLAVTIIFGMLCEITILPALICQFKGLLGRSREH